MKIYNIDYQTYIANMTYKNLVFIDPPWCYDDKRLANS